MIEKSNMKLTELYIDEVNMAVIKYKKRTKYIKNTKAIKNRMLELNNPILSFDLICHEEIVKEIDKLCIKKLLKIMIFP